MSVTPFGAILAVIICVNYLRILNKNKGKSIYYLFKWTFCLRMIIVLNVGYGYCIALGGSVLTAESICSLLLLCLGIIILIYRRNRTVHVLTLSGIILCIVCAAGLFSCWANPVKIPVASELRMWDKLLLGSDQRTILSGLPSQCISSFITLIRYVFVLIISAVVITEKKDVIMMNRTIIKWSSVTIVYGFIEFILKNVFRINVAGLYLNPFFGKTDATFDWLSRRTNSMYMIQGFFKEASYYAVALFFICILCIVTLYVTII